MRTQRLWQGVRMRQMAASADPDLPARLITLPATWDERAAEALAALAPGDGAVSLAGAAQAWLGTLGQRAKLAGKPDAQVTYLQNLLRLRRAAPTLSVWRGTQEQRGDVPGYVLNAAGFFEPGTGFDVDGFAAAARAAAEACLLLAPGAPRLEIGLAGLDDLLACLGLEYASRAAREVGAALAACLRAAVELGLEGDQPDLLATGASWPKPPKTCFIPKLAEMADAARARVRRAPDVMPATGIFVAGPVEALLGIETGGIAPAFSPVRERHLTRAAQHRLAAAALSPEAALATVLEGGVLLPVADLPAHAAMLEAVAPYLEMVPPLPTGLPAPEGERKDTRRRAEPLPSRRSGVVQKASVGGHRVFLRTGEYADGRLGEFSLTLPRENASVRSLAECFAQAVSLGLQHGIALEEFAEAFALTRFGPAGNVEGDAAVSRATSFVDYAMRSLMAHYTGKTLAEPEMDDELAQADASATPLLPMDLPRRSRPRLRLVA
jgi:hypothetical protein